jgi:putative flippase GtrA
VFYIAPLRKVLSQQVFRYLACGATNAALDAVWYYLIYHYLVCERYIDLSFVVVSPHIASLVVVFPITFLIGFWLNRNVAFRTTEVRTVPQMLRYALTVVGSILLNYLCMKFFVESLGVWATPSKMLTTVVCAVYSYLVGRYYTFRK